MASLVLSPDEALFRNAKDKVIIITGGADGIGKETLRKLHSYGAKVTFLDINENNGNALAQELGSNVTFVKGSVTVWADQLNLFAIAEKTYGPIDIVYANAGIDEIEDTFVDTFDESGTLQEPSLLVLNVTLKGNILTAKIALSTFHRTKRCGALVFTASAAAYLDTHGVPIYSAAKHGILGLARSLREQTAREGAGIRVNVVAPAFVQTALTTHLLKIWQDEGLPINQPEHVARALLFSGLNEEWHGKGIYVAGGTFAELEQPLLDSREQWLGKQNTEWVNRRKNKNIKLGIQDGKP